MKIIVNQTWKNQLRLLVIVISLFLSSCNQDFSFREIRYEFKPSTKFWIPISLPDSFTLVSNDGRSEKYLLNEFKINHWLERVDNFKKEYFRLSSFEYGTENNQKVFGVNYSAHEDFDWMDILYKSDSFRFSSLLVFDERTNICLDSLSVGGVVYYHILRIENSFEDNNEVVFFARGFGLIRYDEMNGVIWDRIY